MPLFDKLKLSLSEANYESYNAVSDELSFRLKTSHLDSLKANIYFVKLMRYKKIMKKRWNMVNIK